MKDFENSLKIFKEVPHDRIDDYVALWLQDNETHLGFAFGSKAHRVDQTLQRRLDLLVFGVAGVLLQIEEGYLHEDPQQYGILDKFVDEVKEIFRITKENPDVMVRTLAEKLDPRILH